MRCDHCGTPCTKRHPVVIDRAVAMVGSDCARKFPRARPRDLIRDLATYYKRYTLEREPPIETSGAFTNPWSLERFLSDYHGHGWERKKQSKKDNSGSFGERHRERALAAALSWLVARHVLAEVLSLGDQSEHVSAGVGELHVSVS